MIREKGKHDTPKQPKYHNTLISNLIKPKKKNMINVDSDDELDLDCEERMPAEYEQISKFGRGYTGFWSGDRVVLSLNLRRLTGFIGILDQTQIIETLKERMEEIDFLIYYFTGKQSKKQKHKMGKKVFKEEKEQDQIDDKLKYDRIVKKIPKNLRTYIKVPSPTPYPIT